MSDINVIQQNITEVLCGYEADLRSLVSDLLSEVDQKPIQAVHEAVNALDNGYRNFERKLYACFPQKIKLAPILKLEDQQEAAGPNETIDKEKEESRKITRIKRPRKPKADKLTDKEKAELAIAKHDYAVNTRLMPLGDIKRSMPDKLKEIYPYSTVYVKFTTPLLKALESEGIRTPAEVANLPFSAFKALVNKHSCVEVSNSCIMAFADIYGIKFSEKSTLF